MTNLVISNTITVIENYLFQLAYFVLNLNYKGLGDSLNYLFSIFDCFVNQDA